MGWNSWNTLGTNINEQVIKEIADTMGISLRTVEAHMYKALKFLRERLGYLNFMLVLFLLGKV